MQAFQEEPHTGKGEKAGQEPTRSAAMQALCVLGVARSCIPASEGCPPEPEGRPRDTIGAFLWYGASGRPEVKINDRRPVKRQVTEPGLQAGCFYLKPSRPYYI